ncbi:MAG: selenocysteine-specific translation elongation factor, partial [Gemmatimonadaceae bacterium]
MILGTAGHIDHGKTSLVKALTGVDTDRLPEEKRRGITIDLGFAPLVLEGVGTIGIVDVPGHEGFIRTMLAGASGIDIALLVIAADEGVMPQTREHLEILSLLAVREIIVVLSKSDLVNSEWLALVHDDAEVLLADSSFPGSSVIPVSAESGAGMENLRNAIAAAAGAARPRGPDDDVFRMPIDRVFTIRGTGTVVTGTIWSGSVSRESTLVLRPGDRPVRVRGVQTHGKTVGVADIGERAALALAGCEVADVSRGSVLVSDPAWVGTTEIDAEIEVVGSAPRITARTRLRFHLGTSEIGCRIAGIEAIEPVP